MLGRNGTDRCSHWLAVWSVRFDLRFAAVRTFVSFPPSVRWCFALSGVADRRCEPWPHLLHSDLRDHALRPARVRPDCDEVAAPHPVRQDRCWWTARNQAGPFCAVCAGSRLTPFGWVSLPSRPRSDTHAQPDRRCLYVLPLGLASLCSRQVSPLCLRRVRTPILRRGLCCRSVRLLSFVWACCVAALERACFSSILFPSALVTSCLPVRLALAELLQFPDETLLSVSFRPRTS